MCAPARPQDLITVARATKKYPVTRETIFDAFKSGRLTRFRTRRRVRRVRRGRAERMNAHPCLLSESQLKAMLTQRQAERADAGDGLTFTEVMDALGVCRSVVERYEVKCDELGGEPLTPAWGRRNGRAVKLYPPDLVVQIRTVHQAAVGGRVVIGGVAYLDTARSLEVLREAAGAESRLAPGTLQAWRRDGCVHLGTSRGGRPPRLRYKLWKLLPDVGRVDAWHREDDVQKIARSLRLLREGKYETLAGNACTSRGAAQELGCSRPALYARVRRGELTATLVPNRRGPGKQRHVFTGAALKGAAAAERQAPAPLFDGTYDDGSRINLARVEKLLEGVFDAGRSTLTALVRRSKGARRRSLDPELKSPPGGGRPQWTVLTGGAEQLRKDLEAAKALKLTGKWGTLADVAERYRRSGTVLCPIALAMRDKGMPDAQEVLWEVSLREPANLPPGWPTKRDGKGNGTRFRYLWVYNLARFEELLSATGETSTDAGPAVNAAGLVPAATDPAPSEGRPATRGGRPDQNTVLVNFAAELRERERLTNKEVLARFRQVHPDHPIFKNKSPEGAFRVALTRARAAPASD